MRMRLNAQAFNALGASLSSSCGEAQLEKLDMTETIPTNQVGAAVLPPYKYVEGTVPVCAWC